MNRLSLLTYEVWFVFIVAFMAALYLMALRPGAGRKAAENALIPFAADEDEAPQAPAAAPSQEADHG